jgi:NADH dehydrogenase FAD-containing subunit
MPNKIVIIGAGFAGVWSALSAKRLIKLTNNEDQIQVLVIAPEPSLVIRPRLYEAKPSSMIHSLSALFQDTGIEYLQGYADGINTESHTINVQSADGSVSTVSYDRLILAAGSSVIRPNGIAGMKQHAFDVDSLASATELETHIKSLSSLPASTARDTIVVCGAGFTGIEVATELPKRLGHLANRRIILVDNADQIGPELGPGPRPIITQALKDLGIQVKLGSAVAAIDGDGVSLESGEYIGTKTCIWTAGVRATPLTQQIPSDKDKLGRLRVDRHLRVPSVDHVYATGDAACAVADDMGHYALMSCQHAMPLGRVSGHNAAADLLGGILIEYVQGAYGCCLDLGAWGTVICGGWDREVKITGDLAKKVKYYINQKLIYPPIEAEDALQLATPVEFNADEAFAQIIEAVA